MKAPPVMVLFDGDDREIWSGSMHDFARRNGSEVVREIVAQFRSSLKVNGRLERAFIGGGASPHFFVDLVRPLSRLASMAVPMPNGTELSLAECAISAEHHAAHLEALGLHGTAYDLRVFAAKFRNLAAIRDR